MSVSYSPESYKSYSYRESAVSVSGTALPISVYAPEIINDSSDTAVVCIHGGAWTSSLKEGEEWQGSWMRHHASLLSSLGYYALEITHTNIAQTDICGVISDIKTAFEVIKNTLMPRHGIKRLLAIGDSAGGHLALISAFFEDKALRPDKVVACNPVSDLTDPKWQLGASTAEDRKKASPLFICEETETEILILHGDSDQTVPIEYSHKLHSHLTALGVGCELEVLSGAAHAFILYGYKTPNDKVNEYMQMALDFLGK